MEIIEAPPTNELGAQDDEQREKQAGDTER